MFGEERLHHILADTLGLHGEDVCDRLLSDVQSHSGRPEFEDDVCLVVIEAK
jgi:serine phosphatase RsbU (regulator of sigma subunit)